MELNLWRRKTVETLRKTCPDVVGSSTRKPTWGDRIATAGPQRVSNRLNHGTVLITSSLTIMEIHQHLICSYRKLLAYVNESDGFPEKHPRTVCWMGCRDSRDE